MQCASQVADRALAWTSAADAKMGAFSQPPASDVPAPHTPTARMPSHTAGY